MNGLKVCNNFDFVLLFRCETIKCIGNWKSRDSSALLAPTIESVLKQRMEQLRVIKQS
jgi:hypothetical protein